MKWLDRAFDAMFGRVWQAFFGYGHAMTVRICTDAHVYAAWVSSIGVVSSANKVAPHLDVELRVWNRGAPSRTVVSYETNAKETYSKAKEPTGPLVLDKSGKPLKLEWRFVPKKQPLEFKPGDVFAVTLNLNNGTPKRFKTKVT